MSTLGDVRVKFNTQQSLPNVLLYTSDLNLMLFIYVIRMCEFMCARTAEV
jgi:hypothetical protein